MLRTSNSEKQWSLFNEPRADRRSFEYFTYLLGHQRSQAKVKTNSLPLELQTPRITL